MKIKSVSAKKSRGNNNNNNNNNNNDNNDNDNNNNNNNNKTNNNYNDSNNNDILTDPLGGSFLLNCLQIKLNYIYYNHKINQIKLLTNYIVEAGLTESNYSKTT